LDHQILAMGIAKSPVTRNAASVPQERRPAKIRL
jgi:hypothetical protein